MEFKRKKIDGLWVYEVSDKVCQKMFSEAEKVLRNTYPKPNKCSAVCLTKSGKIYPGISYHSDVYTLTMHAEMTALAHAAIHGEKEIIAMTGPNCHICKQLMWESAVRSGTDIVVILNMKNVITKVPLSTMMVYPWPAKDGTR